VNPPEGKPRKPAEVDPYHAFNESWLASDSAPRKKQPLRPTSRGGPFPLFAVVVVLLAVAAPTILGVYLVGGVVSLIRK